MMELKLNDSVYDKYKIFQSAMEPGHPSKGSVLYILERVLSRSRVVKPAARRVKMEDGGEHHRLESV